MVLPESAAWGTARCMTPEWFQMTKSPSLPMSGFAVRFACACLVRRPLSSHWFWRQASGPALGGRAPARNRRPPRGSDAGISSALPFVTLIVGARRLTQAGLKAPRSQLYRSAPPSSWRAQDSAHQFADDGVKHAGGDAAGLALYRRGACAAARGRLGARRGVFFRDGGRLLQAPR